MEQYSHPQQQCCSAMKSLCLRQKQYPMDGSVRIRGGRVPGKAREMQSLYAFRGCQWIVLAEQTAGSKDGNRRMFLLYRVEMAFRKKLSRT